MRDEGGVSVCVLVSLLEFKTTPRQKQQLHSKGYSPILGKTHNIISETSSFNVL